MSTEGKKKAPSKSEILNNIAQTSNLSKKDVSAVLDALSAEIQKSLGKKGAGQFTVPGLCKITVQRKPATKERQGVNPFTKEPTTIKAKPARNVVKIRPLKALKDMV